LTASTRSLRDEIIRLGPWHLDVQVTPELSTRVWLEAEEQSAERLGPVVFLDLREDFQDRLGEVYEHGLEGRSFLDCGCNCGGYVFWAREIGAGECFGFDVREHWIRQARFLREHRGESPDEVRFEVADIYDLPTMGLRPFDVTLFKGILYHLPEPVGGLRAAAEMTNELMIVNTATMSGWSDGALVPNPESTEQVMSGVHGLGWYPSGPDVVVEMLRWVGFVETRLVWWRPEVRGGHGRLELLASKKAGLLDPVPQLTQEEAIDRGMSRAKSA
jgi:tRNA (mo5U34)-methyltransferase